MRLIRGNRRVGCEERGGSLRALQFAIYNKINEKLGDVEVRLEAESVGIREMHRRFRGFSKNLISIKFPCLFCILEYPFAEKEEFEMAYCRGFYLTFKENMGALGLPVPASLFSTQQQALTTIGAIATAVKTFGSRVTIGELIGAGVLSDVLVYAGSLYASWYVGAAIGSLLVASGHSLSCSNGVNASRLAVNALSKHGIRVDGALVRHLASHPEVFAFGTPRHHYGVMGLAQQVAA
ncbi:UNVERIFIED_ORG: hypothetical protein ABIC48_002755 [Burkholderia territorii]